MIMWLLPRMPWVPRIEHLRSAAGPCDATDERLTRLEGAVPEVPFREAVRRVAVIAEHDEDRDGRE